MYISWWAIGQRLLAAWACGLLLGWERQRCGRVAGLRAHVIATITACVLMIISAYGFWDVLELEHVSLDPSRVAAQIGGVIAVLGAGMIIFRKNAVSGLETAASVIFSATIGMAAGGGLYFLASFGTGVIFITQLGLRPIENRFFPPHKQLLIKLLIKNGKANLPEIERLLKTSGFSTARTKFDKGKAGKPDRIVIRTWRASEKSLTLIKDQLIQIKDVEGSEFQSR